MHRKLLALWGLLFLLCAILGLIPQTGTALQVCRILLSLAFFVPGFALLRLGNRAAAQLVRNLSILSLGLTAVMLVANFASVTASPMVGTLLYITLAVISVPMITCGYWALSLFLWACLMICALKKLKRR